MFSGCQFSLYPMTDRYVDTILSAVEAMRVHHDRLRIETDDLSTTLIGPPDVLFAAMRDGFVSAAAGGLHVVAAATVSRGCPGEPDDPICGRLDAPPATPGGAGAVEARAAPRRFATPAPVGVATSAQISLYPLGSAAYMDDIVACIAFLKKAVVFETPKHFASKLHGDAAAVFAAAERAFLDFSGPDRHVVLSALFSANSPSRRR